MYSNYSTMHMARGIGGKGTFGVTAKIKRAVSKELRISCFGICLLCSNAKGTQLFENWSYLRINPLKTKRICFI
jgi:hypothetical protein